MVVQWDTIMGQKVVVLSGGYMLQCIGHEHYRVLTPTGVLHSEIKAISIYYAIASAEESLERLRLKEEAVQEPKEERIVLLSTRYSLHLYPQTRSWDLYDESGVLVESRSYRDVQARKMTLAIANHIAEEHKRARQAKGQFTHKQTLYVDPWREVIQIGTRGHKLLCPAASLAYWTLLDPDGKMIKEWYGPLPRWNVLSLAAQEVKRAEKSPSLQLPAPGMPPSTVYVGADWSIRNKLIRLGETMAELARSIP